MSEEESRSDSESGSDEDFQHEIETTGLIATRAKRANAGNLYESILKPNLDDEEVRRELLAEDEGDEGDYEGSDRGDDDSAFESSSDEDDAGPPQEGAAEDLAGEKELKRAERVEQQKKRKAADARMKIPAWHKKRKTVTLADDAKAQDGSDSAAQPKPKKKSERANWLPTDADGPRRQSGRALAVANRESVHANLKESYERSEKQRRVMKKAAERERGKKRQEISQEARLKVCEKIAKQTDKEFGRWEREEAERQRRRDEERAAKRSKGLDGPYVRYWSGSAIWRGEKMVEGRVEHGSMKAEELKEDLSKSAAVPPKTTTTSLDATHEVRAEKASSNDQAPAVPPATSTTDGTTEASVSWLPGIHEYASHPPTAPPDQQVPADPLSGNNAGMQVQPPATAYPTLAPAAAVYNAPPTHAYPSWPPGVQSFNVQLPPPPPVLREQAQRSLIMLEQFDNLETTATTNTAKRSSKSTNSGVTPNELTSILTPDAFPTPPFTSDELRYLLTKHTVKRATIKHPSTLQMPAPPAKPMCAIIPSKEAGFRDPKTGLPYLDSQCYKILQRVLAGGCCWGPMLGCWVGPSYGVMGRPAVGVPQGFGAPPPRVGVKKELR
jgi:vacuolar protein sorting-associated protein 72